MEPPAKFARTTPMSETSGVHIVLRNTAAQVENLPSGFERVLVADRDHVLQVMVKFHAALEPNNASKQWAVSPESHPNGGIHYLASFTGYAGLVKTSVLSEFERAHASLGVQTFADLKFTSADRKNTGAITLEIPSKAVDGACGPAGASGTAVIGGANGGAATGGGGGAGVRAFAIHPVPESPLAVPFVAAGDGNPANATAEIQVDGALAAQGTVVGGAINNRPSAARSEDRQEPREVKRKGFLSKLLSSRLLGLGDGEGGEASEADD